MKLLSLALVLLLVGCEKPKAIAGMWIPQDACDGPICVRCEFKDGSVSYVWPEEFKTMKCVNKETK